MTCSYYKCTEPIRDEDLDLEQAMKFCIDHGAEIDTILKDFDSEDGVKRLMGWYVKAKGEARRMAGT